jgi:hypothetical protein
MRLARRVRAAMNQLALTLALSREREMGKRAAQNAGFSGAAV